MNWLQKLLMGSLKKQLEKEMKAFAWSTREVNQLIAAGYDSDQINLSQNMIREAGASWVDRQVK